MFKKHPISRSLVLLFYILLLSFLFIPKQADAHAVLLKATPSENSSLDSPPKQITLTFNERLENGIHEISVIDRNGVDATSYKAKLSKNHRQLSIKLPTLKDGVYAVSYKVTSQDGHPVRSTYVFSIGKLPSNADKSQLLLQTKNSNPFGLVWFFRSIYYASLLLITGWVIWGLFIKQSSGEEKRGLKKWLTRLNLFYLYMLIIIGLGPNHDALLSGHFLNTKNLIPFFTETIFGVTWGISLILAILGIFLLQKSKVFDFLWVLIIICLEGISGHAINAAPSALGIGFDILHLASAAVWSGGLFYIMVFWKNQRERVVQFLPQFSQAAFASIILLLLTGSVLTLMLIPDIAYLTKDLWGILILAKFGLIIFVILIGAILRKKVKHLTDHSFRKWFLVDFSLMVLVTAIVGGLTYTSPLPENKPLHWKDSQHQMSISAEVSPNQPGIINHMEVHINTPDGKVPNDVQLALKLKGKSNAAPIHVPLDKGKKIGQSFVYSTDGSYLSVPGVWNMQLTIYDSHDDYTVFTKEFSLY